jgi:hypothetical protein
MDMDYPYLAWFVVCGLLIRYVWRRHDALCARRDRERVK